MENRNLDSLSLYIEEIQSIPLLDPKEEIDLARKAKTDLEARNKFIEANLRLSVYVVMKLYGLSGQFALDLIQEGNLGLMKAVNAFDPDRGVRFATYALYWIWRAVSDAIKTQEGVIRLPCYMVNAIAKVNCMSQEFEQENGREPALEEMADLLGVPIEKYLTIEKAQATQNLIPAYDTINKKIDKTFVDLIADDHAADPYEIIASNILKNNVVVAMTANLNETEIVVVGMRFGLYDGIKHTRREVGDMIGLSAERVRQMERVVLRKMRGGVAGSNEARRSGNSRRNPVGGVEKHPVAGTA